MLASLLICIQVIHNFTSDEIRHFVLDILSSSFGLHLVINHSDLIGYYVLAILLRWIRVFHDFTNDESIKYKLDSLLSSFRLHLVIEQWFKQTLCIR